jgi:hypothetical protein
MTHRNKVEADYEAVLDWREDESIPLESYSLY